MECVLGLVVGLLDSSMFMGVTWLEPEKMYFFTFEGEKEIAKSLKRF